MMSVEEWPVIGNLVEAGVWGVFSLLFLGKALRTKARLRRLWLIVAMGFLVFGISDIIESKTGAWWQPPGLLALKASCIAVFLYGVVEYRRTKCL